MAFAAWTSGKTLEEKHPFCKTSRVPWQIEIQRFEGFSNFLLFNDIQCFCDTRILHSGRQIATHGWYSHFQSGHWGPNDCGKSTLLKAINNEQVRQCSALGPHWLSIPLAVCLQGGRLPSQEWAGDSLCGTWCGWDWAGMWVRETWIPELGRGWFWVGKIYFKWMVSWSGLNIPKVLKVFDIWIMLSWH